jgi:transcriptional regulator with XRE-family HTH domain
MSLPVKMKELRLKKGMSLQDVAEEVGVSKAHIWDLETGRSKNPSMELVVNIAKCFGVSVSYLMDEDVDAEPEGSKVLGMYRDLKSLTDEDLNLIQGVIDRLKE